jgi:hypothetical protein
MGELNGRFVGYEWYNDGMVMENHGTIMDNHGIMAN